MPSPLRLVAFSLALAAVLLAAGCSSDDDGSSDETTTTSDASAEVDESCLPEDPDANFASSLREYVNCVIPDEPLNEPGTGVSSSGDPSAPGLTVELAAFVEVPAALELCETASPLLYDELALDPSITVVAIEDDGSSGAVLVQRSGADGTCEPA